MIAIREEIRAIERGEADREGQPAQARAAHGRPADGRLGPALRREQAFFPAPWRERDKYWPPVGRVDNAYGDRNLVCACPPMEAYQEAAE